MTKLQRSFALPGGRHLPGVNARPEGGPVAAAASAARGTFDPADWAACPAYLYGFELLAGRFFWEAHEVWEPAWMRCLPNGRERAVLQGLIQCANAGLKAMMGRPAAAHRLLAHATALFDDVRGAPAVLGVDPVRAASALRGLRVADPAADVAGAIAACPALRPICNIMQ